MLDAISTLSLLALLLGLGLGYAAIRYQVKGNPLVDQIDAILPQTQCGQCDFPGCRPYAEAIASGEAEINQCPPGGQEGVDALAELLSVDTLALNQEHGETNQSELLWLMKRFVLAVLYVFKLVQLMLLWAPRR